MGIRICLCLSFIIFFTVSNSFGEAVVSKKKEIAIFPVYPSIYVTNIPGAAYSHINYKLSDMKRFKTTIYSYEWSSRSVEHFFEYIRAIKIKAALNNVEYIDAELGVVVIPGDKIESLVNSTFIFVPNIESFDTSEYQVEVIEEKKDKTIVTNKVTEYKANVDINIRIMRADGSMLDRFRCNNEFKSRLSLDDAWRTAINNGLLLLEYMVRSSDEFRLRTKVLERYGIDLKMELGSDMGIEQGYEFALIKSNSNMEHLTDVEKAGFIRVRETYYDYSKAVTVMGDPMKGDQLLETPMLGFRIGLYSLLQSMSITDSYDQFVLSSYQNGISKGITNSLSLTPAYIAPVIGLSFEYEFGFALLLRARNGILITNPLTWFVDIGFGYEFYNTFQTLISQS